MNRLRFIADDDYIDQNTFRSYRERVQHIHDELHASDNAHKDYLGWLNWPHTYDEAEVARIERVAATVREQADVVLVIGIGGSYLGAKAAIQMLTHSFHPFLSSEQRKEPVVLFVGQHISGTYVAELFDYLEQKDVVVNVISKSGTTTEPALAFRILRTYLEKRYGKEEANERIIVTTDREKGALKQLADQNGYDTFTIPSDIGGRYSVLTPVGLLPMAVSGIDIRELLTGAQCAATELLNPALEENEAYQYAVLRHQLYDQGKVIEQFVTTEPALGFFAEWWKQLFGESEGKDGKGLFPTVAQFTTDLHSLGQYIQEGRKHLFETILTIDRPRSNYVLPPCPQNIDQLNELSDRSFTLNDINAKAVEATVQAHTDGGVPACLFRMPELTAYHVGYLFYFFKKACAMSAYLLGVHPFNQPGVEAYKSNLFQLLGLTR